MSVRATVLLWAQRVIARKNAPAHQVLEIAADAGPEAAQAAFYKIARLAHPDLHRTTLTAEELELVTTAYARAAAAYQELRGNRILTARMKPVREPGSSPAVPITEVIPTSPPSHKAVPVSELPPALVSGPLPTAQAMGSRALVHYRKAELSLRRGDLPQAVLQLKMAIASDPQSSFLRSALAEVEAEVGKKP
jgi:hypothetical protein